MPTGKQQNAEIRRVLKMLRCQIYIRPLPTNAEALKTNKKNQI